MGTTAQKLSTNLAYRPFLQTGSPLRDHQKTSPLNKKLFNINRLKQKSAAGSFRHGDCRYNWIVCINTSCP
jgi:hypothetical protein